MPPIKGKPRKPPFLACRACGGRKITVSSGSNRRVIHGKTYTVASCTCANAACGNEWWSYHADAITAMRHADEKKVASVTIDGSATVATTPKPKANPKDVDRTEK